MITNQKWKVRLKKNNNNQGRHQDLGTEHLKNGIVLNLRSKMSTLGVGGTTGPGKLLDVLEEMLTQQLYG